MCCFKQIVFVMNAFLCSAEEITGDINDVKRLSTQCLNSTLGKRLISKQEAVVMTSDLPFTVCTETVETVPISNSKVLQYAGEEHENKKFIERYRTRLARYKDLSLHEYFDFVRNPADKCRMRTQNSVEENTEKRKRKNVIIPYFSGVNGYPVYPVSEEYARHCIIVYKPWSKVYPTGLDWIVEFESFLVSGQCPTSCAMAYDRVRIRYYDKMTGYNPKSSNVDHSGNTVDDDDMDLMELCGLADSAKVITDHDTALFKGLHRGVDYPWDKDAMVSSVRENYDGAAVKLYP